MSTRNLWYMRQFYGQWPILNAVRSELRWTHYRLLLKADNENARLFYLNEAIDANWSTRTLERQIGNLYYERMLMSRDKGIVKQEAVEKQIEQQPQCHAIKDNKIEADIATNSLFLRWSPDREPGTNEVFRYKVGYRPVSDTLLNYYSETVTETTHRINGLTHNTRYDVFVQPLCVVNTLPDSVKATYVTADIEYVFKCGEEYVPSQRIMGNLKTQLAKGEVFYVGNLPVAVSETLTATNNKFTGSGKITFVFQPLQNFTPGIGVDLHDVMIDNNNRLVAGYIQSQYDATWKGVVSPDALFLGGSLQAELMSKDYKADETVAGVINGPSDIQHTPNTPTITVYAQGEGGQVIPTTIQIGVNPPPNYIIKDAANNYYAVNTATGEASFVATYHGNIDEILAGVNMQQVDAYIRANFESHTDSCPYAFDPGDKNSPYFSCSSLGSKYENLIIGTSTNRYYVPWKFVPTGSMGKVQFTLNPKNVDGFTKDKLKLYTSFGAGLNFTEKAGEADTYSVDIPPGEARTNYDLYAVYTKADNTQVLAGKLFVRTESPKTYPVTLVAMEGVTAPNPNDVKKALDEIYEPFDIEWDVLVIDGTVINATNWDFNGNGKIDASDQDEFLSEYSEEQKALHATFVGTVGKETDRSVVFLFSSEVGGSSVNEGAKLGDMPINRKWGYMFGVSSTPDARTLAHELGHGRLTLRHTFSSELCGGQPGHTANLMDYTSTTHPNGTELNRFQWEAIHNPALIGKMFQDDEDGAAIWDHGYVQAAKVLKKFIEKSGGVVEYLEKDNGDIQVTGYLVESIFFINVDYTFYKTEDNNKEQLLKYVTFLDNFGVGLYDSHSALMEPGLERLIWYGKKSDAMFAYDPPRFVTFTADWLFSQPYGVGLGTILSLIKGENWRTGEEYNWSNALTDIGVNYLIRVSGKKLIADELGEAFWDLFASYSIEEVNSFYSKMDENSIISKNIFAIDRLKKGFKNIFPVINYDEFEDYGINPARCFIIIEASEFYDEKWPIDISNKIYNFTESISSDMITFTESEPSLDADKIIGFVNSKIKQNNIKGMTIFYLN